EQSNYPIALLVVPGPSLRLILIRDSARVSQRFANELLDYFQQLLVTLVDETHSASDCVDAPSLGQALSEESDGTTLPLLDSDCGSDATQVLSWIAEQVALKPNEPAVEFEGNSLSYRELEVWSNRIADQLIKSDVKLDQFVGLCLQPSLEMIAAILGVMKAGAAYVPLDPAYPQEIVARILEDAKLTVVLSHKAVSSDLFRGGNSESQASSDASVRLFDIESLLKSSNSSSEPPKEAVKGTDYAYMIYTSGSTGTPKGVPVTHRNLDYSTSARKELYGTPPEKFLLMSSVSFDSSIAGIFWTLASGGTLVLTSQEQRTDANSLAILIEERQITHTLMLPSLYELVLESADIRNLDSLQFVIVAGESCSSRLGKKHFRKAPASRLFNEYGPTEATVWCSVQELTRSNSGQEVPIGRSIRGTELFVTDALGRLVPAGEKGEICVAGPGVVEGYWERPSLSKNRFFSRKTSNEQTQWIYRTGDIGFVSASGDLIFCGRNDHQVKVRGHRVELPALESLILECEGAKQVKITNSYQGLVAHVVGTSELEESLRTRIANSLPEYMAPTQYHFWSEFPRLPFGKR
ncbi:MAG: amino acid adenylation domain-containing protein, partial [Planctomycetota bacterium]